MLIAYLCVMDWRNTSNSDEVANRVLSFAQQQAMRPDPRKLDAVAALLGDLRKNPGSSTLAGQLGAAKHTIEELRQAALLDAAGVDQLLRCLQGAGAASPPTTADIEACEGTLAAARERADRSGDVERLRVLRELSKDAREFHQSFRAFWIQAAQLVLLNLLLPVLTALLGYIFGSQQGERRG